MFIDPLIGELVADEDGECLEGTIDIAGSSVSIYCFRSSGPTEQELSELKYIIKEWSNFVQQCDKVLKPLFSREDYLCLDQFDRKEAKKVKRKALDSVWNLIELESICFPPSDDTKSIDLYFSNYIDLDHGLRLLIHNKSIVRVDGIKFRIENGRFIKSYENGY